MIGHYQGNSLTNPMLIIVFQQFQPEGHWERSNRAGLLSPARQLVGFDPATFSLQLQHLNPLCHSPRRCEP